MALAVNKAAVAAQRSITACPKLLNLHWPRRMLHQVTEQTEQTLHPVQRQQQLLQVLFPHVKTAQLRLHHFGDGMTLVT